jgi:hypothetical protein
MKNWKHGLIIAVIAIITLAFAFTACSKRGGGSGDTKLGGDPALIGVVWVASNADSEVQSITFREGGSGEFTVSDIDFPLDLQWRIEKKGKLSIYASGIVSWHDEYDYTISGSTLTFNGETYKKQ